MGDYVELTIMRVVPVRPGLISGRECILEGIGWCDWALSDTNGAVGPGCCILEETVPVLNYAEAEMSICYPFFLGINTYNASAHEHGCVGQVVHNR